MSADDLLLAIVVLGAAITQGVIGFGFGMVVMSVAPRFWPMGEAVPFAAVFGVIVSGTIFWRYRKHVSWRDVGPMLAGAALGLPVGVTALRTLDPDPCIRVLGVVIVLTVLFLTWPRRTPPHAQPPVRRWVAVPAGLIAGLFGGAYAMGGPPVIAYASARRFSPAGFKGVLQGFFVTTSIVHLTLLGSASMLTPRVLERNLLFLPLVPLGVWIGTRYGDRWHPSTFRRVTLAILFVLGLGYALMGR